MRLSWPIAYTDHPIARKVPTWPSWAEFHAYVVGSEQDLYANYTLYNGHMVELTNSNDPRNHDAANGTLWLWRIPETDAGQRELLWRSANGTLDNDALIEQLAQLRLEIFRLPEVAHALAPRDA